MSRTTTRTRRAGSKLSSTYLIFLSATAPSRTRAHIAKDSSRGTTNSTTTAGSPCLLRKCCIMAGPKKSSNRDNSLWTQRMLATPNGSLTPDQCIRPTPPRSGSIRQRQYQHPRQKQFDTKLSCLVFALANCGGFGPRIFTRTFPSLGRNPSTSQPRHSRLKSATRARNQKRRNPLLVRTRYQYGSLRLRKRERGPDVWEFRYYETDAKGQRKRTSVILGDRNQYATETQARKATQALLLQLNGESPRAEVEAESFGTLLARYDEC